MPRNSPAKTADPATIPSRAAPGTHDRQPAPAPGSRDRSAAMSSDAAALANTYLRAARAVKKPLE